MKKQHVLYSLALGCVWIVSHSIVLRGETNGRGTRGKSVTFIAHMNEW